MFAFTPLDFFEVQKLKKRSRGLQATAEITRQRRGTADGMPPLPSQHKPEVKSSRLRPLPSPSTLHKSWPSQLRNTFTR